MYYFTLSALQAEYDTELQDMSIVVACVQKASGQSRLTTTGRLFASLATLCSLEKLGLTTVIHADMGTRHTQAP